MPPSFTSSYYSPPRHHNIGGGHPHRRHTSRVSSAHSTPATIYASPITVTSAAPTIDDLDDAEVIGRAPNCSVCDAPAKNQCGCELASLVVAVEEAEQKTLGPVWDDIRRWVTSSAQSQIHSQFHSLSSRRRAAFSSYISNHRHQLSVNDLNELHRDLQRGIDADWRSCVQRYPEVLDHYYAVIDDAVRSGRGIESIIYSTSSSIITSSVSRGHGEGGYSGGSRRRGAGRMRVVYE